MPGPRHTEWAHTHVVGGSQEDAAPYLNEARKVLGFVMQDASNLNLQTHKVQRRLPDGAVVVGELTGGIPRMTIKPPPKPASEPTIPLKPAFVVHARDNARLDGIDPTHPQQIIKPEWQTFFYDGDVDGYAGFVGRKGTYRFGAAGADLFPDGVRHAGNIDWIGPQKERLSWQGPSSRYWFDRWRQPSAQYGHKVYLLGQVLLDIDSYCIDSDVAFMERMVLGAALHGTTLYVVQALIDDLPTDTDVPVGLGGDVFVSAPYPTDAIALRMVRYTVVKDPTKPPSRNLSVALNSHATVWVGAQVGGVNPWFFSQDAKVCETLTLPAIAHFSRYQVGSVYTYSTPSTGSEHIVLTIDQDDDTAELTAADVELRLHQTAASAVVAIDYDELGARCEMQFGYEAFKPLPDYSGGDQFGGYTTWALYFFQIGDTRIPVYEDADSSSALARWSRPYTFDIRSKVAVLLRQSQVDADWLFRAELVIRRGDGVEHAETISTKTEVNDGPPYHEMWHAMGYFSGQPTISPFSMLLGATIYGHYNHSPGDVVNPQGYYEDMGFNPPWYLCKPDQRFGIVALYGPTDGSSAGVSSFADRGWTAYWNDRVDGDGFNHPLALAVGKKHLMYSGPGWLDGYNAGEFGGAHYVTKGTLPDLSGVNGANPRYHPIWMLGEAPRIAL